MAKDLRERKGFELCAGCDKALIGGDIKHWLENGQVVCDPCYKFAKYHQKEYKGTICGVCGFRLAKAKNGKTKFCLNRKNHPKAKKGRRYGGPPCPNPSCSGEPMHSEKEKLRGKKACKNVYYYRCDRCEYEEAFAKVRCNRCGMVSENYRRILVEGKVQFVCGSCEKKKRQIKDNVLRKSEQKKPLPPKNKEICFGCGGVKYPHTKTINGEKICRDCYGFAIYFVAAWKGDSCPIHQLPLVVLRGRKHFKLCVECAKARETITKLSKIKKSEVERSN